MCLFCEKLGAGLLLSDLQLDFLLPPLAAWYFPVELHHSLTNVGRTFTANSTRLRWPTCGGAPLSFRWSVDAVVDLSLSLRKPRTHAPYSVMLTVKPDCTAHVLNSGQFPGSAGAVGYIIASVSSGSVPTSVRSI